MNPLFRSVFLGLCFSLFGCASHHTTFHDYGRAVQSRKLAAHLKAAPQVSDGLAINYANSVEHAMRLKFTGSRITREISSTTQVALAALGGAGAAFSYGASTVATLSLGSAGIPELQRIFNAKGRAEVYKDAAQMIRRGILEYYSHNPNPPSEVLTPNGIVLVQRVSVAIDMVDDVLAGHMPSQMEMLEAVEAMTPAGVRQHTPGTAPVNAISTNPKEAALNMRVDRAVAQPVRSATVVSREDFNKLKAERDRLIAAMPQDIDFTTAILSVDQDIKLTAPQKKSIYEKTVEGAGLRGTVEADPEKLMTFFQDKADKDQKIALSNSLANARKAVKP